jgi:nucleoid-associated protein YgaU
LQKTIGNQAVLRMLSRTAPAVQTKLTVNQPGDQYEQEADRVADRVMRMPDPIAAPEPPPASGGARGLHRKCSQCEEEEKVQRKEAGHAPEVAPQIVHEVLREPGEPLDPNVRGFFEPRFGYDLGRVRVHTTDRAAQSAKAVRALAYTVGPHVAFAAGRFSPSTASGRHLLAHELAHVAQAPAVPAIHRLGEVEGSSSPQPGAAPAAASAVPPSNGDGVTSGDGAGGAAGGPGAALLTSFPSLSLPSLLPAPCNPATSRFQAQALHAWVSASWLTYTKGFGPQTTDLWSSYLDTSAGIPRAARTFSGKGEIVDGFTKHHKSAEAEAEIVKAAAAVLATPAGATLLPAPGGSATVPLTSVIPAATLSARIGNASDPMGLDYDSPATTIPGNIAGGIGSGGPPGNTVSDPDTRGVAGALDLARDPTGTHLSITPALTFQVHDTVDFCPGALGGLVARAETVPMSILEATEARFGTVFAADVPFDVSYPGPGTAAKTITIAPTPPAPTPPTPTPPTPTPPTPAPTSLPATYTVVTGDSLWKIANAFYGNPLQWRKIYAANVATIGPDPNLILPGQVLTIPP